MSDYQATIDAKAAKADASAAITAGAVPCVCGAEPHGIAHAACVGKRPITDYEIGCLATHYEPGDIAAGVAPKPVRAPFVRDVTRDGAVKAWNELIAAATAGA